MEPQWRSCSLAAGCLVLLLGCWGPKEAVAAVSAERPPCSLQALPTATVAAGRGGSSAEPRGDLLIPFKTGLAEGGLPGGHAGTEGAAAGRGP